MDKKFNIIDLNERKLDLNRKIYLQGEDDENVKINTHEIMKAREFLMEKSNLLEYKDRINLVTSYLDQERQRELARMLSGHEDSQAAVRHAAELLQEAVMGQSEP